MPLPEPEQIPGYFEGYVWDKKHRLYGYPQDDSPEFLWIASLEARFAWLRLHFNDVGRATGGYYLIREMINWGGAQNGVLQKFEEGAELHSLHASLGAVVAALENREEAIGLAIQIPGMGLTYASKLLRFLSPSNFGALDSRLVGALEQEEPELFMNLGGGGNQRLINRYIAFLTRLDQLREQLAEQGIDRPACALLPNPNGGWRLADLEMALFQWAAV